MKLSKEEKERRKENRRLKKYNETHKIINGIDHKICRACKEWFPSNDEYFYKAKNFDGLDTNCKQCTKDRAWEWAKNNPEKWAIQQKKKLENRSEVLRQRARDAAKEYRLDGRLKEWQRNNKDKLSDYNKSRSMYKKHEISDEEWENCKNYFNYRCAYCGLAIEDHYRLWYGKMKQFDLHKEHVNHNGSNDLSNCVPACQNCNSQKWKYELYDWYNENNENFTQERLNKIHKWLNEDYLKYKE